MDEKLEKNIGYSEKLIKFIKDRPGHDYRYAIDATRINKDLGWSASVTLEDGISKTINWYIENKKWLENIINGDYRSYNLKKYSKQ